MNGSPNANERSALADRLREFIDELAAQQRFSGAVLLARPDAEVLSGAWGLACRRNAAPNRVDTRFNLASINKMFTAVALAQLREAGRLRYDDPVAKILGGEWLPLSLAERITIRHLLTHTSGLGSYFDHPAFARGSRLLFRGFEDYRPLLADATLRFRPGTGWAYSNSGYLVAGAILQRIAGAAYYECIMNSVLRPAGMQSTGLFEIDRPTPNLALGYSPASQPHEGAWVENSLLHVVKGGPAGGGYSTVHDLLAFDRALRGGRLLRLETLRELLTPTPQSLDAGQPYGMGFSLRDTSAGRVAGHAGNFPGISTQLDMFLDTGWTLVVLANQDRAARAVVDKAIALQAD